MNEVLTAEVMPPEQEAKLALDGAMQVVTRAKMVVVKTDSDYALADAACATIKAEIKAIEAARVKETAPLNAAVGRWNARAKNITAVYTQALDAYRVPMTAFQAELARVRKEAEDAAFREKARLVAEARAVADAQIAAAKLAQAEADAARAAVQDDDPFAALLAADDLEEAERNASEQKAVAEQSIRDMATIEVAPAYVAPRVTGSASKTFTVWDFEITDAELVPIAYRPIDTAALARDVKAGKDECRIPGVRVFSRIEVR